MASYTQLYAHCVWSTAQRKPIITPALEPELYALIAAKCYSLGCVPMAIGGISDHVHLIVRFDPVISIAKLVGQVKGFSAHAVNQTGGLGSLFYWQNGYGAFTISKRSVDRVTAYVLGQKERHRSGLLIDELENSNG